MPPLVCLILGVVDFLGTLQFQARLIRKGYSLGADPDLWGQGCLCLWACFVGDQKLKSGFSSKHFFFNLAGG